MATNMKEVFYKHLLAWDIMMQSSEWWQGESQAKAALDNAPRDAIYRDNAGIWHRFSDVSNKATIDTINQIIGRLV